MNYDYNKLVNDAMAKNEMYKLLCGYSPYEIEESEFVSDVFPTDISAVLVYCIYKSSLESEKIRDEFIRCMEILMTSDATSLYIAIMYFDTCLFQEERGKAPFKIDREAWAAIIRSEVAKRRNDLERPIVFANGLTKINPLNSIINWSKFIEEDYGVKIYE